MSANIKARRKELKISQEKLAELADLSIQMVNSIEGCRAWVSDKTLVSLAKALGLEVFQLFTSPTEGQDEDAISSAQSLTTLRQNIKTEINTTIDMQFDQLFRINSEK